MRHLLAVVLLVAGCAGEEAPPPGLIERDTFKRLLLGAELIEARIQHERVIEHAGGDRGPALYQGLFEREGVTRDRFDSTFRWYSEHPLLMRPIYEEVLAELDSMAARGVPFPVADPPPADTTAQPR